MTKENAIKYGEIISKCWEDEVYREEFIRDPESVMLEKGIELEEGITYKVIQAPKLVEYFVLPYDNVREPIQNFAKFLLNKKAAATSCGSQSLDTIIVYTAGLVIIDNVLQGNIVQIIGNNLAEALPHGQGNALITAFAAFGAPIQAGNGSQAALGQAQNATHCVSAGRVH